MFRFFEKLEFLSPGARHTLGFISFLAVLAAILAIFTWIVGPSIWEPAKHGRYKTGPTNIKIRVIQPR